LFPRDFSARDVRPQVASLLIDKPTRHGTRLALAQCTVRTNTIATATTARSPKTSCALPPGLASNAYRGNWVTTSRSKGEAAEQPLSIVA
jgi:hypothetical protein